MFETLAYSVKQALRHLARSTGSPQCDHHRCIWNCHAWEAFKKKP